MIKASSDHNFTAGQLRCVGKSARQTELPIAGFPGAIYRPKANWLGCLGNTKGSDSVIFEGDDLE